MTTPIDEIGHQLYLYRVKCDIALSDRDEGVITQEEYADAIERQKEININAIKSQLYKAIMDSMPENRPAKTYIRKLRSGGTKVQNYVDPTTTGYNQALDQWQSNIKTLFGIEE